MSYTHPYKDAAFCLQHLVNFDGVCEAGGFGEAGQQFAESGWMSLTVSEEMGRQNLPNILSTAANEVGHSANMVFALYPMLSMGTALHSLLNDMAISLQELKESDYPDVSLANNVEQALTAGVAAHEYLLTRSQEDAALTGSVSVNLMMLFGYLCGGWMMIRTALQARAMLDPHEGGLEFFRAKMRTSRLYCEHLLPRIQACLLMIQTGSDSVMELLDEQF